MRRTRWTFAAVLAILAVSMTRPTPERPPDPRRALDFTGIERLELETNHNVKVVLGGGPFSMPSAGREIVVERRGDTLFVSTRAGDDRRYAYDELSVPARLRELDIRGEAKIEAPRPVDALRIRTTHPLSWDGAARRLEIVRHGSAAETQVAGGNDRCDCGVVDVDGEIDELFVTADAGKVYVDRARGHGRVTLDLADGVTFDLENALDLGGVTLVRRPAGADAGDQGAPSR